MVYPSLVSCHCWRRRRIITVDILSRYHYEVAYIVSQLEIPFLDMDIATLT